MLDFDCSHSINSNPAGSTDLSMLATFPCDIMGFEASRRAWYNRKAASSVSVVLEWVGYTARERGRIAAFAVRCGEKGR